MSGVVGQTKANPYEHASSFNLLHASNAGGGECTVELRADDSGVERRILASLSENNEHDVIAQMAFALHLILRVRNTQGTREE